MPNYRELARRKARRYGLDPRIFERQIEAESGFNPRARSPAGAQGIAQIMPGTARSWGVNPANPEQALDAAARNMAEYVRKYGSYENALRAYNAGPGAIRRSRSFPETNNYVAKILRGREPSPSTQTPGRGSSVAVPGVSIGTQTTLDEAGFADAQKRYALGRLIARRNPSSTLIRLGILPTQAPQPGEFTSSQITSKFTDPIARLRSPAARHDEPPPVRARIKELFWQGPGGVNVKEGKRVPQGFVGGHDRHVHVAAPTEKEVLRLARLAQQMGLNVGEHPRFGGVGGGHVANSNHYARRAIDVTGSPAKLRRYAHAVARLAGR